MENEKLTKKVFGNIQDVLANMSEKDRSIFLSYLKKNEILGNDTLEPIILFQYNAAIFVDAALQNLKNNVDLIEQKISIQKPVLDEFVSDFENSVQTTVNQATQELNNEIEKTVDVTNKQVANLNNTVVNLVDNISAYIDTSVAKMLDHISDEKIKSENEMNEFVDILKQQLNSEIQAMIIEILKNEFPSELKKSVKEPIAEHLIKYIGESKKRMDGIEKRLNNVVNSHDIWNVKKFLRDFVVFGGLLAAFKILNLI